MERVEKNIFDIEGLSGLKLFQNSNHVLEEESNESSYDLFTAVMAGNGTF